MINQEEVQHIAKLAKLSLNSDEISKMTQELDSILEHVSMMKQIDTDSVPETSQITGLNNINEPDIIEVDGNENSLLDCSDHPKENHSIRINKMM